MELSELSSTKQEIYALVSSTANPPSLLFAIYASPRLVEQRLLWENLETVASLHSLPWVIAGNFNEVLMNGDNLGGNAISISRALRFQECLNMCNMIDIGFAGPCFTWSNHIDHWLSSFKNELTESLLILFGITFTLKRLFFIWRKPTLTIARLSCCLIGLKTPVPLGLLDFNPCGSLTLPSLVLSVTLGAALQPYNRQLCPSLRNQGFGIDLILAICFRERIECLQGLRASK